MIEDDVRGRVTTVAGPSRSGYKLAAAPSFECYGEASEPAIAIGNEEIWIPVKM